MATSGQHQGARGGRIDATTAGPPAAPEPPGRTRRWAPPTETRGPSHRRASTWSSKRARRGALGGSLGREAASLAGHGLESMDATPWRSVGPHERAKITPVVGGIGPAVRENERSVGMHELLRHTLRISLLPSMLAACHASGTSTPPVAATLDSPLVAAVDDPERALVSPDSPGDAIERFVGEYAYVGGDAERQAAIAALGGALEGLDPITRSFAERKLAKQDPAIPLITIGYADGETSIARLDSVIRAPLGGAPITTTRNGRELEVTHALQSPLQLVETLQGPRGRTVNTFVLHEDGHDLTITTHIEGNHQSTPAVYRLSYRRR